MTENATAQTAPGPDLAQGIASTDLPDGGKLLGHVGEEQVLLVRKGAELFAIGAVCTHYSGPLAEGLIVDETVLCPWHHACFSLRTGEALHAPAFSPVDCWRIDEHGGKVFVREKQAPTSARPPARSDAPKSIGIVGGGAAGFAAAEMLRREKYQGEIVMLSAEDSAPVDRPNLSKDFLAGNAPEDWLPLRPSEFYSQNAIDLRLGSPVERLDAAAREVRLACGETLRFDRLLLATGAEPVRPSIQGAGDSDVLLLRSLADCRALIERAKTAKRVVVLGASFIGLEIAASLRAREIEVHVVAPEQIPMEPILGREMGAFVRRLHEEHGVVFHLGATASSVNGKTVGLSNGSKIGADLIVAGVGVHPRVELAEAAGLKTDRGVVVDSCLETSAPGVFAAGDIARYPDLISGEPIRVEHWVVAERQGQTAALNLLGARTPFRAAPYFWSQHYDTTIAYVGHAGQWDDIAVEGDIAGRDCLLRYRKGGRTLAVVTIFRNLESLEAEVALERGTIG